jgi:flagellar biosynthesis protein FlhF
VRIKSYFADSVQAAIEQARRELGSEAMLVTNRAAGSEARHLGAYEVVFATELPDSVSVPAKASEPPAPLRQETSDSRPRICSSELESILTELRELRRQFQAWRQAGIVSASGPQWLMGNPGLEEAFAELIHAEVDRELAQQLLAGVKRRLQPDSDHSETTAAMRLAARRKEADLSTSDVRAALCEEIRTCFRIDSTLGSGSEGPQIVALVGPPGAGKTATIAKLAVKYGLAGRKPCVLVSLDTLHVGASEQLRCYASLLGMAFHAVETNRALEQTLEEHKRKGLILIDTPGFTASDLDNGCEEAEFISQCKEIQRHLVLPASMRFTDLARISSAFDAFRPSRLIFTRMDETETFGPLLCEAVGSGRPLSFLGTGQRVPDDLEPATHEGLLARLLPPSEKARSVLAAA